MESQDGSLKTLLILLSHLLIHHYCALPNDTLQLEVKIEAFTYSLDRAVLANKCSRA